jgi:hypothetical protein
MPDQPTPTPDRFKAEMPQIPGVSAGTRRSSGNATAIRLVGGLLAVLVVLVIGARWVLRAKHIRTPVAEAPAQLEVPAPAPDPNALLPHATEENPVIASTAEMAQAWSSKNFFYKNRLTGEMVPAILIRLPGGSSQLNSYWAFALKAPYGNCQMEYVTDLNRLTNDYEFKGAKHAMVGNPCNRSVFDPTKMTLLPGDIWVRGALVQGSDLRPPLGVELQIRGKDILAIRME